MDKRVMELLIKQVNNEFFSSYAYLDVAGYFYDEGLDGFGNYYKVQAQEELDHAMLFWQYLQNNSVRTPLEHIEKPKLNISSHLEAIQAVLRQERNVTEMINTIYTAAADVKDYRTMQFLDWFVAEQGEEEKSSEDLLKKYQLFGMDAKGLYELNKELSSREYSAPSLVL